MVFSKVSMLMMGFTLPVSNTVGSENFLHLVANFNLGLVADELGRSSPFMDLILKCVDKLSICLHWIHIGDQRLNTHKDLGNGNARVNGRSIRVNGISGNRLISPMNVKGRER